MDTFKKDFLKDLRETRKSYADMVDFCADSLILNNYILPELEKNGFLFEKYCGDCLEYYDANGEEITREEYDEKYNNGEEVREEYCDIYQYFIIDGGAADRFANYTNELVLYNEVLDIYLLCVCHFGTSWQGVPANWKDPDDEPDDEEQDDDEGGL